MLLHAPLQAREEAPQEAIWPKARVSQRASTSRGRLAELGKGRTSQTRRLSLPLHNPTGASSAWRTLHWVHLIQNCFQRD